MNSIQYCEIAMLCHFLLKMANEEDVDGLSMVWFSSSPQHDKMEEGRSGRSCDRWSRWRSCRSLLSRHWGWKGSCLENFWTSLFFHRDEQAKSGQCCKSWVGRRKLQSWHVGYIGFFHAGQSWRHSKEIEAMIEKNKKGKRGQGKNKDTCAIFFTTWIK